jgi:L-seryl-tRNA(Ser) seleniumtransferase
VALSKKHKIPFVYDLGSGLILKSDNKILKNEPNVEEAVKKGVDLICFSGDKLMGGPQAGIIAGKKKLINKLKKEPMLRALRVCKTTLALLETSFSYFLDENKLQNSNFVYSIFYRKPEEIKRTAQIFSNILEAHKIENEIISSSGQAGGGTIPEAEIPSYSVKLLVSGSSKQRSDIAEKIHYDLLQHKHPVLSVLKKGYIYFDMLTIFEDDLNELSDTVTQVVLKAR